MTLLITWWIISGFIGWMIAATRGGNKGVGLILGALLGPIGWILLMFDSGPKIGAVWIVISILLVGFARKVAHDKSVERERAEQAAVSMEAKAKRDAVLASTTAANSATPVPVAAQTPTPLEVEEAAAARARAQSRAQADQIARKYAPK